MTFVNVTASSVTLMWLPPAEPNGIIVLYTIYFTENNTMAEKVRIYWEYKAVRKFRGCIFQRPNLNSDFVTAKKKAVLLYLRFEVWVRCILHSLPYPKMHCGPTKIKCLKRLCC